MKSARHDNAERPFCKMQALGNDFVLLDARSRAPSATDAMNMTMPMPDTLAIKRISARRHGIGCDQLLVLTEPTHPQDAFELTIFNPDASLAQACGNGTRCVARYVFDHDKNFQGQRKLSLRVAGQRLRVERLSERMVAVDMGVPKFSASALGLTKPCRTETLPLALPLGLPLALPRASASKGCPPADGVSKEKAYGVSMGNPHAVFFSDKSDARLKQDLLRYGASLEKHPLFGEGANISFARCEEGGREVRLFVWERGAGNTRACGSAACATLVAGVRRGLLQREACVRMEGGDLLLAWQSDSAPVVMTGPADYAFFGTTLLFT